MSKVILPKDKLTSLVLAEIRKHDGCASVDSVVVLETKAPLSAANWEIAIVVGSSNPAAIQRASAKVQQHLQKTYRLG
jgi:hypothetical protein